MNHDASNVQLVIFSFFLLGIFAVVYFIPSIVAFWSKHPNQAAILALNIFLGWTMVGWVASLVWALKRREPSQVVIVQHPPSPPH